jgi:hypothetical protein
MATFLMDLVKTPCTDFALIDVKGVDGDDELSTPATGKSPSARSISQNKPKICLKLLSSYLEMEIGPLQSPTRA